MFAELMSGGNVLVTGVESLPSLGLVVTAGMTAVVVAEILRVPNEMRAAIYKSKYMRRCG